MIPRNKVSLLVGGVGGAKLALGLAHVLKPDELTVIVNTGDDFKHFGLHISPDLDTVMYTLAGLANPQTGWGIIDDSFSALEMVGRLGGASWFRLGDRDLGTHLTRTQLLAQGLRLTDVTGQLRSALGIPHTILPMTDDAVATWLDTDQGALPFQIYFVRERWQPVVSQIRFEGIEHAKPSPEVIRALAESTLIVIGPSNPFLSIDPILAVPGVRQLIQESAAPCIAVSPVSAGEAFKGPTVKLMAELRLDMSVLGVTEHYHDLVNAIILDDADADLCPAIEAMGVRTLTHPIFMSSLDDKIRLARTLLDWSKEKLL